MESLLSLRNVLPSTMIAGDLTNVTIRISVKDIAEAIARQIRQANLEVRYEIQGDAIVFTIVFSPQLSLQAKR